MSEIILPEQINQISLNPYAARFEIRPLYSGYGTTLGNALRRVLFSSLPGAAITAVKIKNVNHEFSTLPYIKEDVIQIILNLKQVRIKSFTSQPQTLKLIIQGEKQVKASDFEKNSQVEIFNPDLTLATLTDKKAELNLEVTINQGRGYVPIEMRKDETPEIGTLLIDAIYTPIKNVGFSVEHTRVGQMVNFDKLNLTIETDGTISPEEALKSATQILVDQFNFLLKTKPKIINKKNKVEVTKIEKTKEKKVKTKKETAPTPKESPTKKEPPTGEEKKKS